LTRAGVRVGAGVAGVAASAVVVIAALTLPLPSAHAQADSRTVRPVPATATAACPGPLLSLASDSSSSAISAAGTPTVIAGGEAKTPDKAPLNAPDVRMNGTSPLWFDTPAVDGKEPLLAAAQSLGSNSADLKGFAAANCSQPGFDEWLVGGATSLGATTLIVLSNPGDVAATVNIDTYLEQGIAAGAGGHGILVQPHTQHVVPLAGLAPNATATIVHVTSTGGTVSAELQQSQVSGVTPQGVDWVGPTAAPSKKVVVPGVVVMPGGATAGSDADNTAVPALRVLPIGDKDAKLTIGVKPEGGSGSGQAMSVTVSHGIVSEVPLDKISNGTYTVTIDSSEPVVAAARSTTSDATAGTDFAWYVAAQQLTGAAAIALTPGPNGYVHFVNPTAASVSLKLDGPGGGTVSIPAGASTSRAISTRGVLTTTDAQGLYLTVGYNAAGQLAGYVAYPTGASASALTVYKR
jgi:hypothetical protein